MKKHHRHENDCLNCGSELQGHYCHTCGQENLHVKEPFWHFLSHSISHYFHFDSKFFGTLKPLLTQPGQLTLDYLAGRRMRYLHPVCMYIFVSIIYFLVVPKLHPKVDKETLKESKESSLKNDHQVKDNGIIKIDDSDLVITKPGVKDTTSALAKNIIKGVMAEPLIKRQLVIDSLQKAYNTKPSEVLKQQLDSIKKINKEQTQKLADSKVDEFINKSQHKGFWNKIYHMYKASRAPEFKKELEHYRPKIYFVLMPVFAFFLMLNFRRNHRYYVEHIVFTIHFFTAFFIFETIVEPINYYIFRQSDLIDILIAAAIFWYCYRALRLFYQRERWATIRKMITLSIFYGIAFSISIGTVSFFVYLITD
ncbi:MAG: DUF3667 domain-containing protein [Mucilaginibacter sp.]|uniref:DUF3667 domain-containing protein n=1 Tax=Mucilaginibacter sp. TaxID=1882438 RepID=UPI003265E599